MNAERGLEMSQNNLVVLQANSALNGHIYICMYVGEAAVCSLDVETCSVDISSKA